MFCIFDKKDQENVTVMSLCLANFSLAQHKAYMHIKICHLSHSI